MTSKRDRLISQIILGFFTIYYAFSGIVVLLTLQNLIGVFFIICATVALGAIIGINKENKILLWLGIFLAFGQILDGISSIMNKFVFGDNILISGHLFIAALYLLPIMVMYKIVTNKKVKIV